MNNLKENLPVHRFKCLCLFLVSTTEAEMCGCKRLLLLMPHSGQEAEKYRDGTALLPRYLHPEVMSHILKFPELSKTVPHLQAKDSKHQPTGIITLKQ